MSLKKLVVLGVLLCVGLLAFRKGSKSGLALPAGWPTPKYNFARHPLSPEKVLLGRALFYDPALSKDSTISCSSCHSQYAAFTHIDHALSHGIAGHIGKRNSPAVMNLAWQSEFMWDGRVPRLTEQAIQPITHPDEMAESMPAVVAKLQRSRLYRGLFYRSYGDSAVSQERLLEAISQFMLSLVSAESRYDSVMRGDAAFNTKEQNGYTLFKRHCSSCHSEPLFTNYKYENNGIGIDTELKDVGRVAITHDPADSFRFKVPTLRNIELSSPYMHDGRFKRLHEVVNHYASGIKPSKTLAAQLREPKQLTANDKVDLVAFLMTLTDRHFILNPEYSYPKIFSAGAND